jgi:hypothetical protein
MGYVAESQHVTVVFGLECDTLVRYFDGFEGCLIDPKFKREYNRPFLRCDKDGCFTQGQQFGLGRGERRG